MEIKNLKNEPNPTLSMNVYLLYSYPATGDNIVDRQVVDAYINEDDVKIDCQAYNKEAIENNEDYRYDYYKREVLNKSRMGTDV